MDVIVGFGSLILIPFLGILSLFKFRVFPYLATFVAAWIILGVFSVGGGVTPMGKGDFVTSEQREAWFSLPTVRFVLNLWVSGLAIGVPLLIVTWFYEYSKRVSTILKVIKASTTIVAFGAGLFSFIKFVVIPRLFP